MDDIEWYTPTEDECDAIERAGLRAAWHELQPLKDEELATPKKVLACLKAFRAAGDAMRAPSKALEAAHPGLVISHYPDETAIVCSALMVIDESPDDIHPRSVVGARVAALIQAAKALEAVSSLYSAFDDDDEVFGTYLADQTVLLAEASIKGRRDSDDSDAA